MQAVDKTTRRGWLVWGIGAGFYIVAVFHRMALGVAGLTAEHHLHVDKGELASFTAVQFLVYLGMQVPAGTAIDRIGPRRTLAGGLALIGTGETVFALAHGLALGLAGRALVGVGDAFIFLSVLRLAHAWFPPRMGALLATLTGMAGALGQLIGTLPLQWALTHLGWPATFTGAGVLTVALVFLALGAIRDRPAHARAPGAHEHRPVFQTLRAAWRRPGTRHGFWVHMGLFCPFQVIGALWGIPFLVQGEGFSEGRAATYLFLLVAAFAVAGPIVGTVAGHRIARQNRTVVLLGALLLIPWTAILLWPGGQVPHAILLTGFITCGLTAPAGMVAFDIGRRDSPSAAVGSATALVNCGGFLGAVVCLELVGLLLGAGRPTGTGFQHALLPMLAISALALVQSARLSRHRERIVEQGPPAAAAGDPAGGRGRRGARPHEPRTAEVR
jgi:sugar phosphate permease